MDMLSPVDRRHEELYFEDGNVVISAIARDDNLVYYRIHKSLLSRYSPVFRDMFSMPSPPEVETFDGVPLIETTDAAVDMSEFLKALYDISFLPFQCPSDPRTTMAMVGPLTLATKYQVESLRAKIIHHLESLYPLNLNDWFFQHDCVRGIAARDPSCNLADLPVFAAQAVRLAIECDVPSILPAAYYRLLDFVSLPLRSPAAGTTRNCLTRDDFEDVARGQRFISSLYVHAVEDAGWAGRCLECETAFSRLWLRILSDIARTQNPIIVLRDVFMRLISFDRRDEDEVLGGFCGEGNDRAELMEFLKRLYEKIWLRLPSAFNLEEGPRTVF